MNWKEAVEAMRLGEHVGRESLQKRTLYAIVDGQEVWDTGRENCMLAAAWTDTEQPVSVFMGAQTRCLFVPGDEDRTATDWVIRLN